MELILEPNLIGSIPHPMSIKLPKQLSNDFSNKLSLNYKTAYFFAGKTGKNIFFYWKKYYFSTGKILFFYRKKLYFFYGKIFILQEK